MAVRPWAPADQGLPGYTCRKRFTVTTLIYPGSAATIAIQGKQPDATAALPILPPTATARLAMAVWPRLQTALPEDESPGRKSPHAVTAIPASPKLTLARRSTATPPVMAESTVQAVTAARTPWFLPVRPPITIRPSNIKRQPFPWAAARSVIQDPAEMDWMNFWKNMAATAGRRPVPCVILPWRPRIQHYGHTILNGRIVKDILRTFIRIGFWVHPGCRIRQLQYNPGGNVRRADRVHI